MPHCQSAVCGVGHEVLASYFVAISQRGFFVLVGNAGSPF